MVKNTLTETPKIQQTIIIKTINLIHPYKKLVLYSYLFSFLLVTYHCYLKLCLVLSYIITECLAIVFLKVLYILLIDWEILNC